MSEIYTGFIMQTAQDYDMDPGTVKYYYDLFPESFYAKLEEHIKERQSNE